MTAATRAMEMVKTKTKPKATSAYGVSSSRAKDCNFNVLVTVVLAVYGNFRESVKHTLRQVRYNNTGLLWYSPVSVTLALVRDQGRSEVLIPLRVSGSMFSWSPPPSSVHNLYVVLPQVQNSSIHRPPS